MSWLEKIAAETGQEAGRKGGSGVTPPVPPPPADPFTEAEEVARRVSEQGVCLLWSSVLQDYVAFVGDEEETARVPAGYVIYFEAELEELFGKGKAAPSHHTLRLIHEAKKLGAVLTR